MVPDNHNPKRPVTVIDMAGYLFLVVGLLWGILDISVRAAVLGTGLVIFAGLCFVAAAIKESAATLKRND
jgi:hypothetical protein